MEKTKKRGKKPLLKWGKNTRKTLVIHVCVPFGNPATSNKQYIRESTTWTGVRVELLVEVAVRVRVSVPEMVGDRVSVSVAVSVPGSGVLTTPLCHGVLLPVFWIFPHHPPTHHPQHQHTPAKRGGQAKAGATEFRIWSVIT